MKEFYDLQAQDAKQNTLLFSELKNKVVLIVNTASKCGFTPQYAGLELLYKKYKDSGFVILGFPCDQFAHQEKGTNEEIVSFCSINYGVTFPIMSKINVNGNKTHEVFKFLKDKTKRFFNTSIKWNFTKFLISRDGMILKRYAPTIKPESIEKDIAHALGL